MSCRTDKLRVFIVLCIVLMLPAAGFALITGTHGNRPVRDRGWPAGTLDLANLESRLGYWEGPPFGGGEYHFLYRCKDTSEFNEALKTFAAIEAKKLELVVHNGPEYSFWLKANKEELSKEDNRVDWTLTVWIPERWKSLYNSPRSYMLGSELPRFKKPVAAPRIDVYIGGGSVVWEKVKIPKNVVLIDKRPGSVSPEFAGSGLVRGKVFDMATGEPISGAQVVLASHEGGGKWTEIKHGKTNERGSCQIAKIPAGYYEVRVLANGYAPRKQGSYHNKRPEYLNFEIGLARPQCVKGVVVDQDGNPIEGVKVSATNVLGPDGYGYPSVGDRTSTTDAQGRFEICLLPKGLMTVRCRCEGLHLKSSIFEQYKIPSDQIKLVMTGTGTVWGKVVDKDGNRPAGGIILELEPEGGNKPGSWGGSWNLSPDGSFKMTGIPPGKYIISTRPNPGSSNYEPNSGKVTIKGGMTYEIEILHEDQRDRAMNVIRKFLERRLKNEQ